MSVGNGIYSSSGFRWRFSRSVVRDEDFAHVCKISLDWSPTYAI